MPGAVASALAWRICVFTGAPAFGVLSYGAAEPQHFCRNDRVAKKALQRQHCDTTVSRRRPSRSARAILSTVLVQPRAVGQNPVLTARYRMAVRTDIDCQAAFQRGCGLKMIATARARDIQRAIRRMTTIHLHKDTPTQAPKGSISDSFKHSFCPYSL